MTTTLLKLVADLNISLAAATPVGATTATLSSAVDSDGVALPSGKYGFTIDGNTSAKEYIVCDLVGTALTNVQSISKQGAATTGFVNYHRVGAVVTVTDWSILDRVVDNLTGTTGFDSGTTLKYDGQPTLSDPTAIPTVQYVLDTANGGAVSFNATVVAGDAGETIVSGDWVYFKVSDGRWYKTDADDTAKCIDVRIGKARGAGTAGNAITGGVFIDGLETVATYVAGTTYYIGNTAGALSTSAGTNSVVVGVGDNNGALILRRPTPSQTDAMLGGGDLGTPSTTNKFMTQTGFQPLLQDQYDAITFPTVMSTATNSAANSNAVSQTSPSGTTVGDLIIVILGCSTLSAEPSGYTRMTSTTADCMIYAKIATGTDTFTATKTLATDGWATIAVRINNFWGASSVSNIVTATSDASENPPNHNANNTYGYQMWIAGVGNSNTGTYSAAPSGYTGFVTVASSDADSGQRSVAFAYKTLRAIEENPGTFTESGTTTNSTSFTASVKAAANYLLT